MPKQRARPLHIRKRQLGTDKAQDLNRVLPWPWITQLEMRNEINKAKSIEELKDALDKLQSDAANLFGRNDSFTPWRNLLKA